MPWRAYSDSEPTPSSNVIFTQCTGALIHLLIVVLVIVFVIRHLMADKHRFEPFKRETRVAKLVLDASSD